MPNTRPADDRDDLDRLRYYRVEDAVGVAEVWLRLHQIAKEDSLKAPAIEILMWLAEYESASVREIASAWNWRIQAAMYFLMASLDHQLVDRRRVASENGTEYRYTIAADIAIEDIFNAFIWGSR